MNSDAATGLGGAQFRGNFGTAIGVEEVKGKIERRRAAVVKDKRHRTLSAAEEAKVHHPAVTARMEWNSPAPTSRPYRGAANVLAQILVVANPHRLLPD